MSDTKRTLGEQIGNHSLAVASPPFHRRCILPINRRFGCFADDYIDGLWQADDLATFCLVARNLTSSIIHHRSQNLPMWPNAGNTVNTAIAQMINATPNPIFWPIMILVMRCIFLDGAPWCNSSGTLIKFGCSINHSWQKVNWVNSWRIIEISTGWGGFTIYAATQYGSNVTTTTISDRTGMKKPNAAFRCQSNRQKSPAKTRLSWAYRHCMTSWLVLRWLKRSVMNICQIFGCHVIDCSKIMGWWWPTNNYL